MDALSCVQCWNGRQRRHEIMCHCDNACSCCAAKVEDSLLSKWKEVGWSFLQFLLSWLNYLLSLKTRLAPTWICFLRMNGLIKVKFKCKCNFTISRWRSISTQSVTQSLKVTIMKGKSLVRKQPQIQGEKNIFPDLTYFLKIDWLEVEIYCTWAIDGQLCKNLTTSTSSIALLWPPFLHPLS